MDAETEHVGIHLKLHCGGSIDECSIGPVLLCEYLSQAYFCKQSALCSQFYFTDLELALCHCSKLALCLSCYSHTSTVLRSLFVNQYSVFRCIVLDGVQKYWYCCCNVF